MSSDWEEIKRLAADFQRAQLSSSAQRLSERNCIEIINNLLEQKLIDVVFTTDGKEYITPQHLLKEIKDELYVHGGRIDFVELVKILTVDYNIIAAKASEIERSESSVKIINGQLIDQTYLLTISDEINEKLNQQGQITIGELTSFYDLPSDFLLSVVEKQLGKRIHGKQDKLDNQVFFTEAFVERNSSIVRGALTAITKPTPVSMILNLCGIQERLFFSVLDSLNEKKEVPGVVTGKQGVNSLYVPSIYSKNQSDWVNNFYKQNGYLEYSALSRLGISDPQTFIKKHFPHEKLLMLATCAVGPDLVSRVEVAVDDVVSSGSFVNLVPILPSVFDDEDTEVVLHQVLKTKSSSINFQIFNSTFLFTDYYLQGLSKMFTDLIEKKAKECVESGEYLKHSQDKLQNQKGSLNDNEKADSKIDKKEERRKKAAGGKLGGGTQGRETKTKSTKKKYLKGKQATEDSDEEVSNIKNTKGSQKLELIKVEDIRKILETAELLVEEESEELIEEIAQYLMPSLCRTALEAAQKCFELTLSSSNQNRRKTHGELQDKWNSLIMNIRLFEKGYKQFPTKDIQEQLAKYLLKTLCTDVTNDIFMYVGQEGGKQFEEGKELTPEVRVKILNSCSNNAKEPLLKLHKSLNSSSVDDFLNSVEAAMGPGICDMLVKKTDKKRERQETINHRQELIEQLNLTEDPALVLHLTTLIVFYGVTQNVLHASGRFVSQILTFLQSHLTPETFNSLQKYHDLVLKLLTSSEAEEKLEAQTVLNEEMTKIKEIALSFKKNSEKARGTTD